MTLALAARLDDAGHGARSIMVAEAAAQWGKSVDTVWRWLRQIRPSNRARRSDLGRTRHDPDALKQVLIVKRQRRLVNPRTGVEMVIPTEMAIEQAKAEGRITAEISRAAVDRYAARMGMNGRGVRRLTRRKVSSRPNEMHVLDCSTSKALEVAGRNEQGEWLVRVKSTAQLLAQAHTRKRKDEPLGVWIVGVVDHYSGVAWAEYRVARGESFEMVLGFLEGPWGGDPRCDVRGLPETLNADKGPFLMHRESKGLLESLGVRVLPRMPNTPNVGGSVERSWGVLWDSFEAANWPCTPGRELTLAQANQELSLGLRAINRRRHWVTGQVKFEMYQSGLQVRAMPADPLGVLFSSKVVKVSTAGTVRYQNAFYRAPDAWAGQWVEITVARDGQAVLTDPQTGESVAAKAYTGTPWSEFEPRHDTAWEKLGKEAAADLATGRPQPMYAGQAGNVVAWTPKPQPVKPDNILTRTAEAGAGKFANSDEALERAGFILGCERFMEEPGLVEQVKRLVEALEMDKARCEEAFFKLRGTAG